MSDKYKNSYDIITLALAESPAAVFTFEVWSLRALICTVSECRVPDHAGAGFCHAYQEI